MKKISLACLSFSLLFVQATVAITPPGGLDSSFSDDGIVTTLPTQKGTGFTGNAVIQQADGKLVAVGYRNNSKGVRNFAVLRYNDDGSLDTTFNGTGAVTTVLATFLTTPVDYAQSVFQQSDGKLVVAGTSSLDGGVNPALFNFALVRYNKDGSLDETFDEDGIATTGFDPINHTDKCYSVIQQADGKLVAAGTSSRSDGEGDDFALARYNLDGTLDTEFGGDGKVVTSIGTSGSKKDIGRSVIQLADDRLLMVGYSENAFVMVMYNEDGSLDTTFDGDGKMFGNITANADFGVSVIQQADEQIVIAGYSTTPGTGNDFAVARYDLDGTPDATFNGTGKLILPIANGAGADYAYAVIQQPDEKLVIGGYSNGNFALARLSADGSLDATFGDGGKKLTPVGSNDGQAFSVIQQADGKLVLAGFGNSGKLNYLALTRYQSEQDFDDDGVPDSFDDIFDDATESVDTDGDLIGNNADTDDDNDGDADTADNCPLIANSTQIDTDSDGLGDACDDEASLLFTAKGTKTKDMAGYAVAFAGDVNSDGYGDYVVGMSGYDVPGFPAKADAGRAEVISGRTGAVLIFVNGAAAKDAMGFAVAGNADVNNDGSLDVVVGAPKADANGLVDAGTVTVLYGPDGSIPAQTFSGLKAKALFGSAVALGDVNSDSYADIIIGAPKDDNLTLPFTTVIDAGSVTVRSGDPASYSGVPLKTFYGEIAKAYAGTSVAAGDFDGDGVADIIIGAPNDDDAETDPEKTYVDTGSVSVYGVTDIDPVVKVYGAVAKAYFGKSVAIANINDEDGDEILVGAPGDDILNEAGKAIKKDVGSATLLSGEDGFPLYQYYGRTLKAGLGNSVAFGDVNGDAVLDIIAGASKDDKPAKKPIKDTGSVSVWNGADYGLITTLYGTVTKDYFGAAVSSGDVAGNIGADGYADLLIGVGGADIPTVPPLKPIKNAGSVQVLSGKYL